MIDRLLKPRRPLVVLAVIVTTLSLTASILITLVVFSAAGVQNSTREGALWVTFFVALGGLIAGVMIAFADAIIEAVVVV